MSLIFSYVLLLTLTGKKTKAIFKNSNDSASKSKIAYTVHYLEKEKKINCTNFTCKYCSE